MQKPRACNVVDLRRFVGSVVEADLLANDCSRTLFASMVTLFARHVFLRKQLCTQHNSGWLVVEDE